MATAPRRPPPSVATTTPRPAARVAPGWAAAAAALLALILYALTAAPCAWWGDGLELTCAAWTLGIPHPPGYPLYMVLGWSWTHLLGQWMDPGRALTLFSSVCMAGGVGLMAWVIVALGHRQDLMRGWVTPALAVGALTLARTGWDHATMTEVYPLTFVMVAGVVAWAWQIEGKPVGWVCGAAIGLWMGLIGLNHYSGLAAGPLALLVLIGGARRSGRLGPVLAMAAAVFGLVVLGGTLYLPLRARVNPPLNWGDPQTLEGIVWMLRGGEFGRHYAGGGGERALTGLANWLLWWGRQWIPAQGEATLHGAWKPLAMLLGLVQVGVAAAGLKSLIPQRPALGWGLLALLGMTALFAMFYHIADIDPYFLVGLPAAAIGWIAAAGAWQRRQPAATAGSRRPPWLPLIVAVTLALDLLVFWPALGKAGDRWPLLYGRQILDALPPDAVVVTQGDNDIYALWYQQMVLGQRPDVLVVGGNFIFSGWYARYFEREGRPSIPLTIANTGAARHKSQFDAALIHRVFVPALQSGRPLYTTMQDPLHAEYFNLQPAAPLLLPYEYFEWFEENRLNSLPSPVLLRVEPQNAELLEMPEATLERTFIQWYLRQQRSIPR